MAAVKSEFAINDRIIIISKHQVGTIKWVGYIPGKPNTNVWLGIHLDLAAGDCDGSVDWLCPAQLPEHPQPYTVRAQIFHAPVNHGIYLEANMVQKYTGNLVKVEPQLVPYKVEATPIPNTNKKGEFNQTLAESLAKILDAKLERILAYANELKNLKLERVVNENLNKRVDDNSEENSFLCTDCGNDNIDFVDADEKSGGLICRGKNGSGCGLIMARLIDETNQFISAEGEDDVGQNGKAIDPRFSDEANYATSIDRGPGFKGNYKKGKLSLSMLSSQVELNLSQLGKTEKATRQGYKDKQKREVFAEMDHVGRPLDMHSTALDKAKTIFACYRDGKEKVYDKAEVIGGCLLLGDKHYRETYVQEKKMEENFHCQDCNERFLVAMDLRNHSYSCPNRKDIEPPKKKQRIRLGTNKKADFDDSDDD